MDEMGRGIKPLPFGARSKNRAAGHRPGPLLPPASHMGFFSRTLRLHNSPTKFPKLAHRAAGPVSPLIWPLPADSLLDKYQKICYN